jgi:hypothetical protein
MMMMTPVLWVGGNAVGATETGFMASNLEIMHPMRDVR